MTDTRGEFTKKIDQELIMRHSSASEKQAARIEIEKEASERRLLELRRQQFEEVDQVLAQIEEALKGRTDFLRARFPRMVESSPVGARGIRYQFSQADGFERDAFLELRAKDNDTHQALFVESAYEVVGKHPQKNDYITFPVKDVKIARVKKFVEKKIIDFIQAVLGS